MADFATWAKACEDGGLWTDGVFMAVYDHNQIEGVRDLLDTDTLAATLTQFMDNYTGSDWVGTADDLLKALNGLVGSPRPKGWPGNARALSAALRRLAPAMRSSGRMHIDMSYHRSASTKSILVRRLSSDARR
jgi:hypothetical protein